VTASNDRRAAFTAQLEPRAKGAVTVALPFDPAERWGERDVYHVTGQINGVTVRGALRADGERYVLDLGPSWARNCRPEEGVAVPVVLYPEGPQYEMLGPDFQAAFDAAPEARRFFESLATFYRQGFVKWVDSAKREETRAKRIAETIEALAAGRKER
jgi:hypothetical protein